MSLDARRAAQLVAIALILVVVTQIIYFTMSSMGAEINRPLIWTVEAVCFMIMVIFAAIPMVRVGQFVAAWAAIMAGGMVNVIQTGMGIAMFPPLHQAGEAMAPAFEAVLAGAFFFYFAGKVFFGFAATALGLSSLARSDAIGMGLGSLAVLTGMIAMIINIGAMGVGKDWMFAAGASGTVATFFLALVTVRSLPQKL